MTKRHFLFIALLTLVGIQAFADQIDQKQAVEIAVAFMNQKVEKNPSFRRGKKMKSSEMVISHVISSQAGEPNIYILNTRQKGSGFVIVSGDTQISDVVLGYSDTGEFDYENAPENAKAWVDGYAKGIESLRQQGSAGKRKAPKASSSEVIEPLLTTQWNQGPPYNDLCPSSCPTGCVATAMAQIMKYWNWPEQGQGSHTNKNEPSQTVDFSQSHYDWDAMLDRCVLYNESKTAVAKLMYDCGCSVDMMYGSSGSGAVQSDVISALFWYFKYKICRMALREIYEDDWEELLLNELRESRPLLYGGIGTSGSHAFVCDGYAGDGFFHFNFGWGGAADGNFKLDENMPYPKMEQVIIGICPDYEKTTTIVNDWLYQKIDENDVRLVSCFGKSLGNVIIPENVEIDGKNYAVAEIDYYAFMGCTDLKSITIPNSVMSIGYGAFSGCSSLTSITIPNSVTSIRGSAFVGCSSLTSITIPNSVTSIDDYAFGKCPIEKLVWDSNISPYCVTSNCRGSLKEVVLGPNVTTIGNGAFYGCSGLTSITIPNSVTTIGNEAFYGCSGLTSITIPNSVTSIGVFVFRNCPIEKLVWDSNISSFYVTGDCRGSLKEVVLGPNVTTIGEDAFMECSGLTSITIPNSVTTIGNGAFYGCSGLTSITIPNSVATIGAWAFSGCSNLSSIRIGNSVSSIGTWAFSECPLSEVYVSWDTPIKTGLIISDYSGTLYVPIGTSALYRATYPWSKFSDIREYDPATAVRNVERGEPQGEKIYYNLNGEIVNNPTNGIYIIDGKKVLIK